MHINLIKVTEAKIPQPEHGKSLARLARECFANRQSLTIDFEGIKTITFGFFQELFLPLVAEFGADFLKSELRVENMTTSIDSTMQSAFQNLEEYFDKRMVLTHLSCDAEIYSINHAWLIKAREVARQNPVLTELILGITDESMRQTLSSLSLEDIEFIAQSNWLCFTPRFSSQFLTNINKEHSPIVETMLGLTGSIC
ncbi:MAG: STAS-like domain-containing protein [Methylomonas sp.]